MVGTSAVPIGYRSGMSDPSTALSPQAGGSLAEKVLLQCGAGGPFSPTLSWVKPMGQSWLYQTPAVAALGFPGGAGAGSEAQDRLTQREEIISIYSLQIEGEM